MFGDVPIEIIDWARAGNLYLVIYGIGPTPRNEETEVTQYRYILFEKPNRIRISGIYGYKYDWRKDSDGKVD